MRHLIHRLNAKMYSFPVVTVLLIFFVSTITCTEQAVLDAEEVKLRDLRSSTILSYNVHTEIKLHYSQTTVESHLSNPTASSITHVFEVIIPDTAIISGCHIENGGQFINGTVANKVNTENRKSTLWVRSANLVSLSLTLKARSELKIFVRYNQILERKEAYYQHTAYLSNDLIGKVGLLKITTNVDETSQLGHFIVPFNQRDAEQFYRSLNNVEVVWHPTRNSDSNKPCSVSQYTVQYGLVGENHQGNNTENIVVIDDLFFHTFVPKELDSRKHIIFILDFSVSMAGPKIVQLKEAMMKILSTFRSEDYLNIIRYGDSTTIWPSSTPASATAKMIQDTKIYLSNIPTVGGSGTDTAFRETFSLVKSIRDRNQLPAHVNSMIVFITGTAPTYVSTSQLLTYVNNLNSGYKIPIYSVGLHNTAITSFLNTLSAQNYGTSQFIRDDGSTVQQIQEFYSTISSLVISNLEMQYVSDDFAISDVTTSTFPTVTQGVDVKTAGKLTPRKSGTGPFKLTAIVNGVNSKGQFRHYTDVEVDPTKSSKSKDVQVAQKFYAQLKIKQLEDNFIATGNANSKTQSQALSTQHGFVSEYTTMSIRQSNQDPIFRVDPVPILPTTAAKCVMISEIIDENECEISLNTMQCISNPLCIYCLDNNSTIASKCRYNFVETCSKKYSPTDDLEDVVIDPGTGDSEGVIGLRPSVKRNFTVNLQLANALLDFYYLMDFSGSFADDKIKLVEKCPELISMLRTINRNPALGFGAFVDKPISPFGSPGDYSFQNRLSLTTNSGNYVGIINSTRVMGGNDGPESILDGIYQAASCLNNIGWRKDSRRFLLVTTDAGPHMSGDGAKLGLMPFNGQCSLNANGLYNKELVYDYPSIAQIKQVVEQNEITLTLASTRGDLPTYRNIAAQIKGAEAIELAYDSANIIQVIKKAYDDASEFVTLQAVALSENLRININYYSACGGSTESISKTNICRLPENGIVSFTLELELLNCPDPSVTLGPVVISPLGVTSHAKLDVVAIC